MRETESEAWDAANDLIKYVDEEAIATAQKAFARADSEGQQRMSQLYGGSREALEVTIYSLEFPNYSSSRSSAMSSSSS